MTVNACGAQWLLSTTIIATWSHTSLDPKHIKFHWKNESIRMNNPFSFMFRITHFVEEEKKPTLPLREALLMPVLI